MELQEIIVFVLIKKTNANRNFDFNNITNLTNYFGHQRILIGMLMERKYSNTLGGSGIFYRKTSFVWLGNQVSGADDGFQIMDKKFPVAHEVTGDLVGIRSCV
jgi:hypothetical protein